MIPFHISSAICIVLLPHFAYSFTPHDYQAIRTRTAGEIRPNKTSQFAISTTEQICILDGSHYNSLDLFLSAEGNAPILTDNNAIDGESIGILRVVVGCPDDNNNKSPRNRVVGFAVDPTVLGDDYAMKIKDSQGKDIYLLPDSIANVPRGISDEDAIATSIAALTGVHCAYFDPLREDDRILKKIGGSDEEFMLEDLDEKSGSSLEKKIVVLGGGEYASFVSDSLAVLGGRVTQITTNKLLRPRRGTNVSVSPPGIGEEEFSFSSVMNFDSMVDTLSDETKLGEAACRGLYDGDAILGVGEPCSSAVIRLLQRQNRCKRYISTLSSSQRKIRDDGLIWGRIKANNFGKSVVNRAHSLDFNQGISMVASPRHFGQRTLQPLLDAGVIYKGNTKSNVFMHGWNMQDFWELISWPRDADGGNTRFGLPTIEDLDTADDDMEDNRMISAPPTLAPGSNVPHDPIEDIAHASNPFVLDIHDLKELNDKILEPKKDCILFLSAAYCRTCRYLAPQYTKLARTHAEAKNDVLFAKSNASSKIGKEVSRALGVDAVPAFCLFRAGKRYGSVLSVSKIPSEKLDLALDLLLSGGNWDGRKINSVK